MITKTKIPSQGFNKQYTITIDAVQLPENTEQRIQQVVDQVTPVINQIMADAMSVAIGTWPTPEKPR